MSHGHDSNDDAELFRRAMEGVAPIRVRPVVAESPRPPAEPRMKARNEAEVLAELARASYDPALHETGSELVFLRPGYQERVLKKLRRGQLAVEGHLDLHGMRTGDARRAVSSFLTEAVSRHAGCVRIVHGKGLGSPGGEPVLKPQLAEWLRVSDAVIAFCSAPLADGGTGAVYVALKRPKRG